MDTLNKYANAKSVALITGGNKGIGLATSKKFLAEGYRVIAVARDFSGTNLPRSSNFIQVEFDLCYVGDIPKLISQLGTVNILVNNAGMMNGCPYDAYPEDKKKEIIKLNLEAPVTLIREVSKSMVASGKGRIVNNASIAGQIGHPDIWYGITKAGMINMTKSFAKILGPKGIVVNAIAAGPVETAMLSTIPLARLKQIKKVAYCGRFAQPEEVAETIYWLATECPEYMNGVCLDINNGAFPR